MYIPFAILVLFVSQSSSLPQDIKFGGATSANKNEKDPADVKSRLGLVASVLGKYFCKFDKEEKFHFSKYAAKFLYWIKLKYKIFNRKSSNWRRSCYK